MAMPMGGIDSILHSAGPPPPPPPPPNPRIPIHADVARNLHPWWNMKQGGLLLIRVSLAPDAWDIVGPILATAGAATVRCLTYPRDPRAFDEDSNPGRINCYVDFLYALLLQCYEGLADTTLDGIEDFDARWALLDGSMDSIAVGNNLLVEALASGSAPVLLVLNSVPRGLLDQIPTFLQWLREALDGRKPDMRLRNVGVVVKTLVVMAGSVDALQGSGTVICGVIDARGRLNMAGTISALDFART